jgi:hypothetical protein
MNDEVKKAVEKSRADTQRDFPKERASFRGLLLSNPNHFGNLVESPFKPVLPIASNTRYEELACVGYQPQQQQLEGVVYIYQPSGYGTDVCGPGTPEYVRFYLSFDHGASWEDQGMTSFQAHDIPQGTEGGKRLEYAVSLPIKPRRRFCFGELLVRVRAILSWNNAPPANQPNWTPIWGNRRDVTVQLEPHRLIFPPDLFEIAKLKLPPQLLEILDPNAPLATTVKAHSTAELANLYKTKGVPVHRFAYKQLAGFVAGTSSITPENIAKELPGVTIDANIGDILFPQGDGDVSYEELRCIGLDPNRPDTLVGVIQIKRPAGYLGGPCRQGSTEYVTFWADFDGNGSFESCLGTAQVQVHDFENLPADGVYYAVRLPVDLEERRRPCRQGAPVIKIRAILSWDVPAPCSNSNYRPTWGNREETLIAVGPMAGTPSGKIAILGGIPVTMIHPATGLTTPSAVFATNNIPPDGQGRPCPFGARVSVQGAPIVGFTYLVEVSPDGAIWTPVLTDLVVTDQNGVTSTVSANAATNRFNYLPFNQNINGLLAEWNSTGDARWFVRLSVFNGAGVLQGTDTHVIQLDNNDPEAAIEITTGVGNCGKFGAGTQLVGTFVARDPYLSGYSLFVEPAVNGPGIGIPTPNSGQSDTALAPGDSWSLDTTGMRPCGYIIKVSVSDRAILNSQSVGHRSGDSAGFCIDGA